MCVLMCVSPWRTSLTCLGCKCKNDQTSLSKCQRCGGGGDITGNEPPFNSRVASCSSCLRWVDVEGIILPPFNFPIFLLCTNRNWHRVWNSALPLPQHTTQMSSAVTCGVVGLGQRRLTSLSWMRSRSFPRYVEATHTHTHTYTHTHTNTHKHVSTGLPSMGASDGAIQQPLAGCGAHCGPGDFAKRNLNPSVHNRLLKSVLWAQVWLHKLQNSTLKAECFMGYECDNTIAWQHVLLLQNLQTVHSK